MKISGLFTIIIMSAMVVLGYSFYSLWVPGQDIILIQTLSVITILTVIVSGVVSTLFGVYTIVNKLKVNSYVILFQGILNAAIVFLLLKTTNLGIIAVAGVSSITATIRNLTFVPIYTSKCLGVSKKTFYPTIIRYIISSIITIIGDFIISYNIDKSTWFGLICSGIVCVVFASILNYFLFLNKKERKFIIKKLVTIIK